MKKNKSILVCVCRMSFIKKPVNRFINPNFVMKMNFMVCYLRLYQNKNFIDRVKDVFLWNKNTEYFIRLYGTRILLVEFKIILVVTKKEFHP